MKLGRNEKCWCGSGLKFKRCHEGREYEKPISKGEVIDHDNNTSQRETCYAPQELRSECSNVIKAHTVSKSSGLTDIADSTNHVLGLKQNLANYTKNKGKPRFEKIGVNKASTFKGFCAKHDKLLFSYFEDKPFIGTEEQCIALTYRSVAKEIYAKERALITAHFMKNMDRGKPLIYQVNFQEHMQLYELGVRTAIAELSVIKRNLDCRLLNKKYDAYDFLVIESPKPIPVAVSSIVNPTCDFKGNFLQDLSNLRIIPEYLAFNAFSSNNKGFVVFSWLREAKIIDNFINSLLEISKANIFSALINFFFSAAENSFISPDWWNSLDAIQQNKIEELFMTGAYPLKDTPNNILVDNSVRFTGWDVEKIYKV